MSVYELHIDDIVDTLQPDPRTILEYVDEVLDHVKEHEPDIKALVPETNREERLKRDASSLSNTASAWDLPPLYGVPVGVKDIFQVDGLPTQAGSNLPPADLAGPESEVVSRLKDAGALVLGKTVTAEFAYSDPGPTRNPHNLTHTPGGSSSGSAAAVAAGLCPLALGTQTVGSTIRPAAFCGIVGFKPSLGRIPTSGVIPVSKSADHVGLFTQDISGMQQALRIVCPSWDPIDVDQPTLGVPRGPYVEQASEEAISAFERHVAKLEDAGYDVRNVDMFKDIDMINDRHTDLITAEAAIAHKEWYDRYENRYREQMTELIERGRRIDIDRLTEGQGGQQKLRERLTDRMNEHEIDIWLSPAAPGPAPDGIDDTGDPVMNLPWTHSGLPTISLPAGRVNDLPIGLQCAARFGAGEQLLAWSEGIEAALK